MRGILLLVLAGFLLAAGCAGQPQPGGNNTSNNTTVTPPVTQCNGPVCGTDNRTYSTDCDAAVANVSVAHSGECASEPECIASVEGIKTDVVGTVVKGDVRKTDNCINDTDVAKFTCDNNSIVEVDLPCGDGKECKSGACVLLPPQPANNTTGNMTPPVQQGCFGPASPDFTVRTNVTYNGVLYNDTCNDYRTAKDYYCKDNKLQVLLNQCDSGYNCDRGACVQSQYYCSDSDNGENLTVVGTTTSSNGFNTIFDKTDECLDDNTVKEYDCLANGTAVEHDDRCPLNTKCLNGACFPSKCTSNIAWNDTTTGNGVTIGEDKIKHYDTCDDSRHLLKYYCDGDSVTSTTMVCPDGYICNTDTASCVQGSITTTTP